MVRKIKSKTIFVPKPASAGYNNDVWHWIIDRPIKIVKIQIVTWVNTITTGTPKYAHIQITENNGAFLGTRGQETTNIIAMGGVEVPPVVTSGATIAEIHDVIDYNPPWELEPDDIVYINLECSGVDDFRCFVTFYYVEG